MDRREAIEWLKSIRRTLIFEQVEALDLAIEALKKVSVYEQVKWERDCALKTLDEHGIGLGQIAEPATTTEDCISRQAVTDLLLDAQDGSGQTYEVIRVLLHEVAYMPSVPVAESATTTDCISRAEQVTSKLKNPFDSLLKADSEECKEQKSKLDCISRQQAIDEVKKMEMDKISIVGFWELIESLPSVVPDFKTFCGVPIKEAIEVLEKYKHSPSVTPTTWQ